MQLERPQISVFRNRTAGQRRMPSAIEIIIGAAVVALPVPMIILLFRARKETA